MSKNPFGDVKNQTVGRESMPVPSAGIFDDPVYMKPINIDWYRHISGIVQGLTEESAWRGNYPDVARAIDEIHAWLQKDETVIRDCNDVENCLSTSAIINNTNRILYDTTNYNNNTTAYNNYNSFVNNYNSQINKMYPTAPLKFSPHTDTTTTTDQLCDAVRLWVESWRAKFLNYVNFGLGLVNNLTSFNVAMGSVLTPFADNVTQFMLSGLVGIVVKSGNETSAVLQGLKDDYEDDDAIDDVVCSLIGLLAHRSVGLTTYYNALHNLESHTSSIVSDRIAAHMNTMLADENIPAIAQSGYIALIALLDQTAQSTPVGNCGSCMPSICSGAFQWNTMPTNISALPLPPPLYSNDIFVTLASVYWIAVRDSAIGRRQQSWVEYRKGSDMCFSRISFVWRTQSNTTTNGKLRIMADGATIHTVDITNLGNGNITSFDLTLPEPVICQTVRIMVENLPYTTAGEINSIYFRDFKFGEILP